MAIKTKKIYPNNTSCAKKVFKIDHENPKANQVAKGLISAFTPELLAELTDEDPVLGKLKRARQKDDFKAFKKVDANLAQFYPISSISHEGILLVDNRIAIPSCLRKAILNHLHRGHPGQEKMVDAASYVWWPRLHRSIIDKAEKCPECTAYGKNIKTLKPRSKWDKIPDPTEPNEELQIDFAGPFNSSSRSKFHILVAVDRYSPFPSALITKSTGANKILKFLTGYIALHGVPKNIRTDQFSSFKSTEYKQFCKTNNIERKYCPVDDHRANGAVERCIQTIKGRLGTTLMNNAGNVEDALVTILDSMQNNETLDNQKVTPRTALRQGTKHPTVKPTC